MVFSLSTFNLDKKQFDKAFKLSGLKSKSKFIRLLITDYLNKNFIYSKDKN